MNLVASTIVPVLLLQIPIFGKDIRAGAASIDITPSAPVLLSGYASRTQPASAVAVPLHARALAIDDGSRQPVVFLSVEVVGLPAAVTDFVAAESIVRYHLDRSRLVINSTHTHAGPCIHGNLPGMTPSDPGQRQAIRLYTQWLSTKLIDTIGAAIADLQPARLHFATGRAAFAMNRRLKTPTGYKIAPNPSGPVDHDIPVLRVARRDSTVLALLFGYACHNTTLTGDYNRIDGDYSGSAALALEKRFPSATALFFMLCGGDQNPEPRGTAELARAHGAALAEEVARVAGGSMNVVSGRIRAVYTTTELPLQLTASPVTKIAFPVQAVRFGKGFTLLALGGEVVVEYALWVKRRFAREALMVAGYSNDVMAYIPTARMLDEGGYEPVASMKYYGFSSPFSAEVEDRVKAAIESVMKRVQP
jgi:hypothetical protein